jgi:hypothetical protein
VLGVYAARFVASHAIRAHPKIDLFIFFCVYGCISTRTHTKKLIYRSEKSNGSTIKNCPPRMVCVAEGLQHPRTYILSLKVFLGAVSPFSA